jgi:hypothetical protein
MYCVSGSATIGGTTKTNAIFPMPIVDPTASAKVTLSFRGQCDTPDALLHWMQPTIQAAGPTVAVLNQSGTNDGTNGPAFVFAGPYAGYGGEPGLYNNMCMVVDGLTVLCPFNGTYGGWGFFGTAQARIISGSYQTMAIVPSGGAWPQLNPNNISNQWTYGAQMPSAGNNDLSDVTYWSAYGATYGYMPSEHSTALSVRCNYNIIGVEGYAGNGVNMNHGGRIYYASVEANLQGMGFLDGAVRLDVDTLDGEANTNIVYDPINRGIGTIGMRGNAGGYTGGGIVNGGSAITMIQQDMPTGAVTSPQGPPATTAGWLNAYYRPALINLAISGGTLSALTITGPGGAVAQSIPAACTLYFFCVPAGQTYTPTYTGTAAHTVTLI